MATSSRGRLIVLVTNHTNNIGGREKENDISTPVLNISKEASVLWSLLVSGLLLGLGDSTMMNPLLLVTTLLLFFFFLVEQDRKILRGVEETWG